MGTQKANEGLERRWELERGRGPQPKDEELAWVHGLSEEKKELGVI